MKAPAKFHEQLDAAYADAYQSGYDDGKDDGWDDGYQDGAKDAKKARYEAADARAEAIAERDLLAKPTDALGWDRFDVERFRDTGIMPSRKEQ